MFSRTAMASTTTVWCLLLSHEKKPIGRQFFVNVAPQANIANLKKKVLEEVPDSIPAKALELAVWRCMDRTTIFITNDTLEAQVSMASSNVEQLQERQNIADLSIADSETLLVQMPSAFPPFSTMQRSYLQIEPPGAPSAGGDGTSHISAVVDCLPSTLSNVMARLGAFPTNDDPIKLIAKDFKTINDLTPSLFAKAPEFTKRLQPGELGTALYMLNRTLDSNTIPIALLSEVFARFEVNFHVGSGAPYGPTVFEAVRDMYKLSYLYSSEANLHMLVNDWLTRHFDVTLQIGEESRHASDGYNTIETPHGIFLTFVSEGQWSFGGGSGDPTIQGMSYFREFWQRANDFTQYGGCKPALLLVYAGTQSCHCQTRTHSHIDA